MTYSRVIYPGTFDPVTLGHMDIIKRATVIFDYVIVGVAASFGKNTLFTLEERKKILEQELVTAGIERCEVMVFDGLLVDFARVHGISIIVRGLRALSDFEREFKMAYINHKMDKNVNTVFIPASEDGHFIASSVAKEIAQLGGDLRALVSPSVADMIYEKSKNG